MEPRTEEVHVKRERRKQARPGELLDAALDLFVEKGYAATRVEEVAARAGVSKGTLFLYFHSKEELFKAVVRETIAGRLTEWDEESAHFEGSCAEMLRYCMATWWERVGATRASGVTKLMLGEAQNFPEVAAFYRDEVVVPGMALIRRILQRGVDRGEFQVDDMEYAVLAVVAPMIYLQMNKHSHSACAPAGLPIDPARYLRMQADVLLRGLCTRADAPPGADR